VNGKHGLHVTRIVDLDLFTGREIVTIQSQKAREKIAAILDLYRKVKFASSKSAQLMVAGGPGDLMEVAARIVELEVKHALALALTQVQLMVVQTVLARLHLHNLAILTHAQLMVAGGPGDLMEVAARIVEQEVKHALALALTQVQLMKAQTVLARLHLHNLAILTHAQV